MGTARGLGERPGYFQKRRKRASQKATADEPHPPPASFRLNTRATRSVGAFSVASLIATPICCALLHALPTNKFLIIKFLHYLSLCSRLPDPTPPGPASPLLRHHFFRAGNGPAANSPAGNTSDHDAPLPAGSAAWR